jgi:hypothetical protein
VGCKYGRKQKKQKKNSNYHYLEIETVKNAKNLTMDLIHYELLHLIGKIWKNVKWKLIFAFRKETVFSEVGTGKDGLGILGVKMFIIKKYSYPIICTCGYNIFIF